MLINGLHLRIIHATTVEIIRLVDRLQRVGKDFKDVATIFFSASVWEEDGAAEVAELGLTKGSRVSVDGLWSKRTWTTKEGERRVTDVLTVSKVRLFTETEVARPEAVGDDGEPTPDEAIGQPGCIISPPLPWRIKPARCSWPNTSPGTCPGPTKTLAARSDFA